MTTFLKQGEQTQTDYVLEETLKTPWGDGKLQENPLKQVEQTLRDDDPLKQAEQTLKDGNLQHLSGSVPLSWGSSGRLQELPQVSRTDP